MPTLLEEEESLAIAKIEGERFGNSREREGPAGFPNSVLKLLSILSELSNYRGLIDRPLALAMAPGAPGSVTTFSTSTVTIFSTSTGFSTSTVTIFSTSTRLSTSTVTISSTSTRFSTSTVTDRL